MGRPKLYAEEELRLRRKKSRKIYRIKNKEKLKEQERKYRIDYKKKRLQSDPLFKLSDNIRGLIYSTFKNQGYSKQSKTAEILGCTFEEFKQHIESQFEPWMNWSNMGGRDVLGPNITWDLDHIMPVSKAVNEDDIKRLNHYTNFQPLCSYINRHIKRDNYPTDPFLV